MRTLLFAAILLGSGTAFAGDTFSYVNAIPFINALSPATGPAGTPVQILGSGFLGTTAVKFGTVAAMPFSVINDNAISVVAPAGTGTVTVTVTTPNGTSIPPN